ncbi:MAG: DnaJ domain-containing protein [Myxococcales bacterium]|nr:DnaJ domain-containing protein [Myxococcales bacterium]
MAELARGTVLDRPWGRTLGALAIRGLTGQINVISDGKVYQVGFHGGAVCGAHSPLASDSAVRIALTGSLLSSTQVADIVRHQQANPQRDEIELIMELARLAPEQSMRLRRRSIAQRAARTFSLERADFVVEDHITVRFVPGSELDIRSVIYLGARQFLSESRLNGELGQLGGWFQLKPELDEYLPQYGFGEAEQPVLEALSRGAGLAEIEQPEIEQRMARAVVYALVSCGQCNVEAAPRAAARKAPTPRPVASTTSAPPRQRPGDTSRQPSPNRRADTEADPPAGRSKSTTQVPPRRVVAHTPQTAEVELLIRQRLALLDAGADHYALLGLPREATSAHIQKAYFALARQLHPDRLQAVGIVDDNREAQRLFAQVNTAFAVLGNDKKREAYTDVLDRGGEAAVRDEQNAAEQMAERILEAEEAFRKGEAALRRDAIPLAIKELERAMALNPDESDYQALLTWAKFCATPDKASIGAATRKTLGGIINAFPGSVTGRFYLGRVDRMLGRDKEALRWFEEVLEMEPGHSEATAEVRVLQSRLGGDKGGGGGLFGRLKR